MHMHVIPGVGPVGVDMLIDFQDRTASRWAQPSEARFSPEPKRQ